MRQLTALPRIDLLVCDLALPGGVNGRRVAETGRTMRSGMKVLFITGYGETPKAPMFRPATRRCCSNPSAR
ncbi:hypothetical protein CTI14_55640 [Methylobacterium radiotolerans]|nr:hypothetical protein CTI14_55640 [Methylobacterium radiotolerans]